MRLPAALVPLRNATFRGLWLASVVAWLGTWLQNTGAGWLMTTLAPEPLIVAMVQAATIMPVFLLALPGGALADIVDRRVFLIGTQIWTILAAVALAALTLAHAMTAFWLLVLTFAIGIGSALTAPPGARSSRNWCRARTWCRRIALNGIGYNLTRAVGPALAGFLILLGGSSLAFSLYAVSILAVLIGAVHLAPRPPLHRPAARASAVRHARRHALCAQHAGDPVRHGAHHRLFDPGLRALGAAAAVCARAPRARARHVRRDPGHDGHRRRHLRHAAADGARPPRSRHHGGGLHAVLLRRHALLGMSHHWLPAAFGMLLFGLGWTSAYATIQAAAQLVCPPWVRARRLSIYQLAQNGALTLGSFAWGWLGGQIGMADTLLVAAGSALCWRLARSAIRSSATVGTAAKPRWRSHCRCRRRPPPNWSRCCAARADG